MNNHYNLFHIEFDLTFDPLMVLVRTVLCSIAICRVLILQMNK